MFSYDDFYAAARESSEHEHVPLADHWTPTGNYSVSVLERVLDTHQHSLNWVNREARLADPFKAVHPTRTVRGLLIHTPGHYVILKRVDGQVYIFDSLNDGLHGRLFGPQQLAQQEFADFLANDQSNIFQICT